MRESQLRPGSFVLSYLSLDGNVNHYKITAVFGDYYIGGRRFDSLETLVTYYMFYSVIKQNEPLVNPIAPSQVRIFLMHVEFESKSEMVPENEFRLRYARSSAFT